MIMATRLRKTRKHRGSRSHGWGQVKGHRSSGAKGGVGESGRMKHEWTYTVKHEPDRFGHPKLNPPNRKIIKKWINVSDLEQLSSNISKSTNTEVTELDLNSLGYEKLLGKGKINKKLIIKIKLFSKTSKQKIEDVGGQVLEN